MKQVSMYFKSDFTVILASEAQWGGCPFRIKLWTASPAEGRSITACFDGTVWHNCQLLSDGRLQICVNQGDLGKNQYIGIGTLKMDIEFYLSNADFNDHICNEHIRTFEPVFVDEDGEEYRLYLGADGASTITTIGTLPAFYQKGEKGDKGDKGDQGEQGPVGPVGPQGPQGIQGIQGEKGDKGDQGIQGEVGPRGEKGDKGDAFKYSDFTPEQLEGLRGPRGFQGEKGDKGDQGIQGIQGEVGPVGPRGATGPQGPQGIQGIQGEKGDKGDKGDPGDSVTFFPAVTIFGQPHIEGPQISGFSANDYLQFPFVVNFAGRPWELHFDIATGAEVNQQHNIFDSNFGLAFAFANGHFVMAMSSNGTSWDLGANEGTHAILPNQTYHIRMSWDGSIYKLEFSTDEVTWTTDITVASTASLYPRQIVIGKDIFTGTHFYNGSINFAHAQLKIAGLVVWEGMEEIGVATRMAIDLSNIDEEGKKKLNEVAMAGEVGQKIGEESSIIYDETYIGNGDDVITAKDITGLVIGRKYTLLMDDWAYDNTTKNKLQFFWGKTTPYHILIQEKGGVIFANYEFIAEDTTYRINFRANQDVQVRFRVQADSTGLNHKVNELQKDVEPICKWNNIAWFGTSIPAGTITTIPFDGKEIIIKKGNENYVPVTQSATLAANQYPCIVGSILGANVYNEAVGSSRVGARRYAEYTNCVKCLSWSVQEEIALFNDAWNANPATKTYSDGPRNMGVRTFPTITSWVNLVSQFKRTIYYSYQIKLVARYLIANPIEHASYIDTIFGPYKQFAIDMLASVEQTLDDLVAHQADIDLFVIDHIHNDNYFASIDSTDLGTYQGGMNMIIREILRFKPSARIVFVGDYTNYEASVDRIGMQKAMAERWQFPFIDMSKILPAQKNVKALTRGYWDATGVWHDDGFEWSENVSTDSYITNATFNTYIRSTSLATMKQNINPQQIDGIWYWETYPCYLWCFDGLHPHTDKYGRLNKMYARVIADWLIGIGSQL